MYHFVIDILFVENPEAPSKFVLVLVVVAQNNYSLQAKNNCELSNDVNDNVLDNNNHCHGSDDSDDSDGSYDRSHCGHGNRDDHSHCSLRLIRKRSM